VSVIPISISVQTSLNSSPPFECVFHPPRLPFTNVRASQLGKAAHQQIEGYISSNIRPIWHRSLKYSVRFATSGVPIPYPSNQGLFCWTIFEPEGIKRRIL
jgi:hypothetical protein